MDGYFKMPSLKRSSIFTNNLGNARMPKTNSIRPHIMVINKYTTHHSRTSASNCDATIVIPASQKNHGQHWKTMRSWLWDRSTTADKIEPINQRGADHRGVVFFGRVAGKHTKSAGVAASHQNNAHSVGIVSYHVQWCGARVVVCLWCGAARCGMTVCSLRKGLRFLRHSPWTDITIPFEIQLLMIQFNDLNDVRQPKVPLSGSDTFKRTLE